MATSPWLRKVAKHGSQQQPHNGVHHAGQPRLHIEALLNSLLLQPNEVRYGSQRRKRNEVLEELFDVQPSPGKTSDVQRSPAERATLDAHQSPTRRLFYGLVTGVILPRTNPSNERWLLETKQQSRTHLKLAQTQITPQVVKAHRWRLLRSLGRQKYACCCSLRALFCCPSTSAWKPLLPMATRSLLIYLGRMYGVRRRHPNL